MDNYYRLNLENKIYPWAKELLEKLKDHSFWTYEHSIRVGIIGESIAKNLKISANIQNQLLYAGLLHDIGKIYINRTTLNSSKKLNTKEKEEIEEHVKNSFLIIKEFDLNIAQIVIAHHEFQDNPYPRKKIHICHDINLINIQKIIALADSIDSIMSDRPYKKALNKNEAYMLLKDIYDPFLLNYAILQRQIISL